MQSTQRILIGLDLDSAGQGPTEGSQAALEQGLWLASRWNAAVELLFSTHGRSELTSAGPGPLVDRLRASLGEAAQTFAGEAPAICISAEVPWRALIERKQESGADLVLTGKRNQSRRADRKLGSVASKLIAKCPGPVWVVKPGHGPQLPKILAATDLSPVGDLAVAYGASLAGLDESASSELCVAHAWQVPFALQWNAEHLGFDETQGKLQDIVKTASDKIRQIPGIADLGERCSILTANASPDHTILQAAERTHPELAILGVTPRHGLASWILGNTAEKILSQLDCSLLTVKPEDFADGQTD